MSYCVNFPDVFPHASDDIADILRGAKLTEIPSRRPSRTGQEGGFHTLRSANAITGICPTGVSVLAVR